MMKLIKNLNHITCRQDKLHDLAEESTNGVFAIAPEETKEERKKNHDLVNNFIKKSKKKAL
ncbi:hypothetical protein MUB24_22670 [Lederbergia sp. NSJ-179]|uniref:hypothetical protein n=1 Tax=Lederbergia sp. NSJ-179 TaxID=2931402 RepID=UPI001FD2F52D|nr:hypothetical protein [Lederbergia sp. NSJ-179]MCJ7843621.1 hypothetical protein [Lederbergia sp. NSJ-179]